MTGWIHAWRTWLQRRSGRGLAAPVPERPLRASFLQALERALQSGEARCQEIASEIFCLVIPPFDPKVAPDQHHAGIDACLDRLASSPTDVASVTWSSLLQAHPRFEPSYHQWAGAHASQLDGGLGIVFFVDMEAVAQRVRVALERAGYRARRQPDAPVVRVEHGDYQLDIGLEALLIETLWTMRDLPQVVDDRARVVPLELAAYQAMAQALLDRFPELQLTVDGACWLLELGGRTARLPYRGLVRTCRQAGLEAGAFVARCTFDDVIDPRPVHAKVKSPAFAPAYPDAHLRRCGGFVEVLARDDDGGTQYALRRPGDPALREQHLQLLRRLSMAQHRFDGHLFRVEVGSAQAICVAGEQAASLTAEPALLAGLLAAAQWSQPQVRLRARDERGLIIAQPEVVDEALEVLLDTLQQLVTDLYDDVGDALSLDLCMAIDVEPSGHVELREVPGVYFELRDRADAVAGGDAPGREAYFRGFCYELLGRSARAVECFSRALRFDREDGELNLLLGRTLNDLGQFDRATGFLERAVHALPEDADASNSLGVAYQSTGSSQDAVRAFERAAALSPEDPTILVNLGRAYADSERLDLAREILLRALERAPSLFEARASLAMLSLRTGEREDALQHARLALSSRPDDEAMRELVALLTDQDE